MTKMISAIALLSLATVAPAQDNAQTSRSFALRGFDRIEVGGCDIVAVALGSGYAVTARGRAANIDNLRIDTTGSTLRIRRRNDSCNGHDRRVAIAVTLPSLQAVGVSGAAEMNLPALDVRAFAADTSGAGVLRLAGLRGGTVSFGLSGASQTTVRDLQAERVKLDTSGASHLRVDGAVRRLTIDSSGASEVDSRALSAPDVTIGASGTAKVRAGRAEQAQIGASGMANVTVEGHPRCTLSKSGLARITCG
ncbi:MULTISPECIES: GIN domain-containing protein [Sphingomonas]|jgi:hypothetical protein|uniref:Putative auto-transporter adhesin head GIN domain-containing protein n=1 Tax=Sphingomonas zeae TaxID=1646122 RepID=A0A7Y6EFU6_9SPHN|nr:MULTISPECIES: DUF2807 domain-containing protein [Sphingomonas]MBB4049823.1 hypothetical protein [Sphingomonas zeae]MDK8185693.1 DUF2807 domain-containing protein [Sphingomonas zeae]MDK8215166.1 DUF2807 domain-containing protein [Sphingomonas sp. UMB7805-LC452B]NUU45755.1 hypothetical protein [Sphingomonas zeae]